MTIEEFHASLLQANPPEGIPSLLTALWWDGKGDWDRAHNIAQAEDGSQDESENRSRNSRDSAWVHAYLHRKEGDVGNAGYWYRTAGRPVSALSLDEEWHEIASAFLQSV